MKVWINAQCFTVMRSLSMEKFPLETGGILAGYRADNGDVVVTNVIGAGPNATHERYRFEGDYEYQTDEIGRLFDACDGKISYLGDWHTHPKGVAIMSDLDLKCLDTIANNKEAQCESPVMIILGGDQCDDIRCYPYKYGFSVSPTYFYGDNP